MLTRKMLKAMGIEEEKIDQIIDAHTETTDALKADRDRYKDELERLPELQKQLNDANNKAEQLQAKVDELSKDLDEDNSYKEKYESEHEAFEKFKKGVDADKLNARKAEAYKGLLKKAEVSDKRFDAIVKVTAMDDIELDDKGEIKGADKLVEKIKEDWSEFIVTKTTQGAGTETPPSNTGGNKMTKEEIMKIKDSNERQKAIDENHELFGF